MAEVKVEKIIPIGTETKWGTVQMVGSIEGERYYWMINKIGVVSMIPAAVVQQWKGKIKTSPVP